jgi:hypothetical protein
LRAFVNVESASMKIRREHVGRVESEPVDTEGLDPELYRPEGCSRTSGIARLEFCADRNFRSSSLYEKQFPRRTPFAEIDGFLYQSRYS